ncbi:putative ATP-dependent zinc protease [Pseudogemmobacter sp. W21_MBD1_M6]|uniref:putative ATP-dependent zinc protease n=1 Tax=Pseudogemmobacter sp. W21_MBD1_M6 TaxID=3240271 RepID=UPI003F9A0C4A
MDQKGTATQADFRLGWEEWAALPDLGLPALKVKVDTGARTSALHAFDIEPFDDAGTPRLRFGVHPVPGRDDISIVCTADVADRREVISSNGEAELRYVIRTDIRIGTRQWPIEITLTNRTTMAYRMLLGRTALDEEIRVSPSESFCQPKLTYDGYSGVETGHPRPLAIAILTREPEAYTTRRLIDAGEAAGHRVDVIDTARCYMMIDARTPEVHCDGARLPRYDAVIPRIGASMTAYGSAVLRQFEMIGTYCLNGSAGVTATRDTMAAHQTLARAGLTLPVTALAHSPKDSGNLMGLVGPAPLMVKLMDAPPGQDVVLAETRKSAQTVISAFRGLKADFLVQSFLRDAVSLRLVVVGKKVAAAVEWQGSDAPQVKKTVPSAEERRAALRAAKAFGLGFAAVDMLRRADGPMVLKVSTTPALEQAERITGKDIAARVIDDLTHRLRPEPRPRKMKRKVKSPRP